jgi:anti-sigma regulatory factor (Ser/Thr protein kinase)
MGLRGGGFGILLASQLVDDLLYNERHNEVLFVKCLSGLKGPKTTPH